MPFAKCPNCEIIHHLLVRDNIEEWDKKLPVSEDGYRYLECFSCWKKLNGSEHAENLKNLNKDKNKTEDNEI